MWFSISLNFDRKISLFISVNNTVFLNQQVTYKILFFNLENLISLKNEIPYN